MITATGLGSGLDISGLVSQLVEAERASSDLQLNRQNAKLSSKFSALGTIKSKLDEFQSSLSSLTALNSFNQFKANSSDTEALTVSADKQATANDYSVEISQLATSHVLAATAVADLDSTALGTGSLTFRFGTTDYIEDTDTYNGFSLNPDSSITTIEINESNNTLEGVMTAINDADFGVKASIVNDGTGFRLLMSSELTGEANNLEITALDDDGNNSDIEGLSQFAFNATATNVDQTATGIDAQFSLNGLEINSASNEVDFAIVGATLNLKKVTEAPLELGITADTSAVFNAVNGFVSGYNQFIETVNELTSYDAAEDVPGALLGDFTVRSVNGQIDRVLRNAVAGLTGASVSTLSEIGITTAIDGQLNFDAEKFKEILVDKPQEIAKIFSAIGSPDNADVSFNGSSSATKVGDYSVEVTAIASAGFFAGASALPNFSGGGSVVIDSDNDNFTITVDGINSGEVTLTAGTYTTGESLAAEIQARINGEKEIVEAGASVTVNYDNVSSSFTITSNSIGSNSSVNLSAVDINTVSNLGLSNGAGTVGKNVEGTINGISAVGTGNVLVAGTGSAAEGLNLVINATEVGNFGTVNFTRGIADQLNGFFKQVLESDGAIDSRLTTLEGRIKEVADKRAAQELRWEAVEARYLRQFNALDTLLAGLQSTSSYLEGQFANLPGSNQDN